MNRDDKLSNNRNAPLAASRESSQAPRKRGLSLEIEPVRPATQERSSDPYNTSGSFDRTKNWARVGKR